MSQVNQVYGKAIKDNKALKTAINKIYCFSTHFQIFINNKLFLITISLVSLHKKHKSIRLILYNHKIFFTTSIPINNCHFFHCFLFNI
jgi:hypothetical protein